jgi:YebC/PmpR family DNA-binding regulatory protein
MSGHSKWANIKRRKESTDKKRGQIFSKLSRAISVAARKEPNPDFNPTLRSIIEKARGYNMPQENIERAIKKSSEAGDLEELVLEGYGPEGVAVIVTATTDNRNRTVSEIKKIFSDHHAKWADPGSVLWAFEQQEGGWTPKFPQTISSDSQKQLLGLFDALDDHDDVVDLYTNATIQETL